MSPQPVSGQIKVEQPVKFERWPDAIGISNAHIHAIIVPAAGGRIASFGQAGGPNLLWVNTAVKDADSWKNWGGDKVWIWPQDDWQALGGQAWPPPGGSDQAAYTATVKQQTDRVVVTLESPEVTGFGVKVRRTITLPADKPELIVENVLLTAGKPVATPLASWTVTQIPKPRTVVARRVADSPLPDAAKTLLTRPWPGKLVAKDNLLIITPSATESGKLGLDIDALGAVVGGQLLVQRLVLPAEQGLTAGERGQLYTEPDVAADRPESVGAYVELEWTGPRVAVAGPATASHTVIWSLHPIAADRSIVDEFAQVLKP